ncbi:hypothetical protein BDZ89DRAFT_1248364 [Hymenopellis radicata]|nr:hypothetical protein BDZ89DRAFT_1248364 [Hymenopellis radicata]
MIQDHLTECLRPSLISLAPSQSGTYGSEDVLPLSLSCTKRQTRFGLLSVEIADVDDLSWNTWLCAGRLLVFKTTPWLCVGICQGPFPQLHDGALLNILRTIQNLSVIEDPEIKEAIVLPIARIKRTQTAVFESAPRKKAKLEEDNSLVRRMSVSVGANKGKDAPPVEDLRMRELSIKAGLETKGRARGRRSAVDVVSQEFSIKGGAAAASGVGLSVLGAATKATRLYLVWRRPNQLVCGIGLVGRDSFISRLEEWCSQLGPLETVMTSWSFPTASIYIRNPLTPPTPKKRTTKKTRKSIKLSSSVSVPLLPLQTLTLDYYRIFRKDARTSRIQQTKETRSTSRPTKEEQPKQYIQGLPCRRKSQCQLKMTYSDKGQGGFIDKGYHREVE